MAGNGQVSSLTPALSGTCQRLLPGPILGVIRHLGPHFSFLYGESTQARFFWSDFLSLPFPAWQHFQHQHGSDNEMVNFRILHGGSRAISRMKTLDFRRTNFGLFKDPLGGILWVRALEDRGFQES